MTYKQEVSDFEELKESNTFIARVSWCVTVQSSFPAAPTIFNCWQGSDKFVSGSGVRDIGGKQLLEVLKEFE